MNEGSINHRNIILVGFMGTGKSSVGRKVASILRLNFIDMDEEIEKREKRSIPEIFGCFGESYFRQCERNLVKELAGRSSLVISAGGGVVLRKENIEDFSKSGLVICLDASIETIVKRIGSDKTRPLLAVDDKVSKIKELMSKRKAYYDMIKLHINTDNKSVDEVAEEVIRLYREYKYNINIIKG